MTTTTDILRGNIDRIYAGIPEFDTCPQCHTQDAMRFEGWSKLGRGTMALLSCANCEHRWACPASPEYYGWTLSEDQMALLGIEIPEDTGP